MCVAEGGREQAPLILPQPQQRELASRCTPNGAQRNFGPHPSNKESSENAGENAGENVKTPGENAGENAGENEVKMR